MRDSEIWDKIFPLEVGTLVKLVRKECECKNCKSIQYLGEIGRVTRTFLLKESLRVGERYPSLPDDAIMCAVKFKDGFESSFSRSELEAISEKKKNRGIRT